MLDRNRKTKIAGRKRDSLQANFDVSPVYDFLLTVPLILGVEPEADEVLESTEWIKNARAEVDPSLVEGLRLFFNASLWGGRLFELVRRTPGAKGVDEFLGMLNNMRPEDIFGVAAYGDYSFWPPEGSSLVHRALSGEEGARRELLDGYESEDRAAVEALLELGAEEVKRRLLGLLGRWQDEVFAGEEQRIRPAMERDAEAKRREAGRMSPPEVVEAVTGGVRWEPTSRMPKVVLVPSVFARPANYSFGYEGVELFLYAVSDENLGEERSREPKPATVRFYKALADPTRLKMLALMSECEMYPREVAEELGLSTPTVHHHLVLLRSAGLLTLRREGALKYHALRPEALDEASQLLKEYIG